MRSQHVRHDYIGRRFETRYDQFQTPLCFCQRRFRIFDCGRIKHVLHGDSAATLQVNQRIIDNPRLMAASLSGIGGGTENAVKLAQAFDEPLDKLNGKSIKQDYEDFVVRVTQEINVQKGTTDGLRNFYKTLESKNLAVSGVTWMKKPSR